MDPITYLGIAGFSFVMTLAICIGYRQYLLGYAMLQKWAGRKGYRLVSSELRSVRRGPFMMSASKVQNVYYVTVEDTDGERKSGYVRCGGFWKGMKSDEVAVRWDRTAR